MNSKQPKEPDQSWSIVKGLCFISDQMTDSELIPGLQHVFCLPVPRINRLLEALVNLAQEPPVFIPPFT